MNHTFTVEVTTREKLFRD